MAILALAAILPVAVATAWMVRPAAPVAAPVPSMAATGDRMVEVLGEPDARWTRTGDATLEKLMLEDGTLRLRVHQQAGIRFLVALPDGEIEDKGTSFVVTVAERRTRAVAVEEGSVVLRLTNRADVVLRSGERWELPQANACESASSSQPPATARSGQRHAEARASAWSGVSSASVSVQAAAASSGLATTDALPEEDAVYVRAIKLLRAGRVEDARLVAREYLRRFPRGFRRIEMERIAQ